MKYMEDTSKGKGNTWIARTNQTFSLLAKMMINCVPSISFVIKQVIVTKMTQEMLGNQNTVSSNYTQVQSTHSLILLFRKY